MSRRNFDTASSDGDSDGNSTGLDYLPSAKRMLMDKFMTPWSKPMATPGSLRQAPRTGNGSSTGNGRNLRVADPIGVFCRLRPWGQSDEERCAKIVNEKSMVLTPPETSMAWKLGTAKELTFSFQQVYAPETEQKLIFENVALPLVEDVLKGKNALFFAYGVTGSGKTFTMSGTGVDSGMMPRCLDVIFNSIGKYQARKFVFKPDRLNGFDVQTQADAMLDKEREIHALTKTRRRGRNGRMAALHATASDVEMFNRKKETRSLAVASEDSQYSVFVTYIEIYNNFVYDLLDETCFDERTKKFNLQSKMLREDASHNVYVNGVTEIEVCSTEDSFDVFLRGQKRRKQAHTALNTASSRSHAVFNIRLVQAPLDSQGEEVLDGKANICVSQLSLVDLAGSERYGRTQATGDRLKEAGNINNSLMTLRKCMDILRDNQQKGTNKPVPYRDSKLTHYLKNYFEGEGRVRMIICLNPRNDDYDENIHVMDFAKLTQGVQVVRPVDKRLDPLTTGRRKANEVCFHEANRDVETYRQENANLKYTLGQMTTEKESVDSMLKTIQFEKNEQDIRCKELENENRQLREELRKTQGTPLPQIPGIESNSTSQAKGGDSSNNESSDSDSNEKLRSLPKKKRGRPKRYAADLLSAKTHNCAQPVTSFSTLTVQARLDLVPKFCPVNNENTFIKMFREKDLYPRVKKEVAVGWEHPQDYKLDRHYQVTIRENEQVTHDMKVDIVEKAMCWEYFRDLCVGDESAWSFGLLSRRNGYLQEDRNKLFEFQQLLISGFFISQDIHMRTLHSNQDEIHQQAKSILRRRIETLAHWSDYLLSLTSLSSFKGRTFEEYEIVNRLAAKIVFGINHWEKEYARNIYSKEQKKHKNQCSEDSDSETETKTILRIKCFLHPSEDADSLRDYFFDEANKGIHHHFTKYHKHESGFFKCRFCKDIFAEQREYSDHMAKHHLDVCDAAELMRPRIATYQCFGNAMVSNLTLAQAQIFMDFPKGDTRFKKDKRISRENLARFLKKRNIKEKLEVEDDTLQFE